MSHDIDGTGELVGQLDGYWTNLARPRLEGLTDEEYLWEPVATIAWRLGHVIVGVLVMRVAGHFGGPPADYDSWPWARTADELLTQLDEAYAASPADAPPANAEVPGARGLRDTRHVTGGSGAPAPVPTRRLAHRPAVTSPRG